MKDLQENIIPAENQNIGDYFPRGGGNGIRVLFVGNSITKHAPKPEIGWTRDCGMAASCLEKDYVHLTVEKIKQYDPQVNFSILQVANFERNFETFDIQKLYKPAIDYKADIIIMFFGTNVDKKYSEIENPEIKFGDKYEELRNALNSHGAATVIHGQCFYIRSVINAEKKAVTERLGDTYVELGDIVTREDTHGDFNHPGDKGMQEISDLFFNAIEPTLKRLTGK